MMERAEEWHGVGYCVDSRRGVGNGLGRERVDVVVDDRTNRMQTDNRNDHDNRETTIMHSIGCCSGTRTGNHNHQMGHDLGASARNKTMPDARSNTPINNNTATAAVGISTPRSTVCILLLNYN